MSDGLEKGDLIEFPGQQGLDVGAAKGKPTKLTVGSTRLPVYDKLSVSGQFSANRNLDQDERVLVQVVDGDGEIIGAAYCEVDVGFAKQTTKDLTWLERRHKAKVESS